MKRYDRRTFLKLSGASAVMLALSACEDEGFGGSGTPGTPDSSSSLPPSAYDPFYSGEITTLGPPLPEAPDSPPIPVIRDGKKIFEIINAELTRRKVQYFKMQYNGGLGAFHSVRDADVCGLRHPFLPRKGGAESPDERRLCGWNVGWL